MRYGVVLLMVGCLTAAQTAAAEDQVAKLTFAFAESEPIPHASLPGNGAFYVYVRNAGSAPSTLGHVELFGLRVDPTAPPPWVAYVRQRPVELLPGELGQVEIRLLSLPKAARNLLASRSSAATTTVRVVPTRGRPARGRVDLRLRPLPLQINFISFRQDLKAVYVYLQKNKALKGLATRPVAITGVQINGRDVTAQARFGSRSVGRDVVPIEIPLAQPLVQGRGVCVTVTTDSSLRTGHLLRAFPSKFNILVPTARLARRDFMEDIYYHGATALTQVHYPEKFKRFGFDLLPMAGRLSQFLTAAIDNQGKPMAGVWCDEVDEGWGHPVHKLTRVLEEADRRLRARGSRAPLFCFNNVRGPRSAASGHATAPDAIMHAYGHFMCPATGRGFGRLSTLHNREYRVSRRPFWPYFRDSELIIPCDPKTAKIKPLIPLYQRVLTPTEERWITFGVLIQGAKSIGHWGYWAYAKSRHYRFSGSCLRVGMGGAAGNRVGPYVLPDRIANMLTGLWDEIGRINAELRTIGPLVARSDVGYLARVARVRPAKDRRGDPAASVAALISGANTLVIVALNQNIDPGKSHQPTGPIGNPNPPRYDPVHAVVDVQLPEWLHQPKHIFSVSHDRIAEVSPKRSGQVLRFDIPRLKTSQIYVITSSDAVRQRCLARHRHMRTLLAEMARRKPVYYEKWDDTVIDADGPLGAVGWNPEP